MPSILARKLGMTQVFGEDGNVARVTVLEAGPCPVTAVRTTERDGYAAIQLAFGATKEKHLTKARLGHLRKADAPPMRALAEFRLREGEEAPAELGGDGHGRGLQPRRTGEDPRHLQGQGLPGHDQAPQLQERAQEPRLPQRPRAGLDRRLGHPLARAQRHPRARPDGQQARHPAGPGDRAGGRRREPAARPRARFPGPRGSVVEVRSDG